MKPRRVKQFKSYSGFKPYVPNFNSTKSLRTYTYPENWESIRQRILKRDNYTCQRCKTYFGNRRSMLRVHHKVPLSRGGSSRDSNLVTLCSACHREEHPHLKQRYLERKGKESQ